MNKNLIIAIKSLIFTIIGIVLLEMVLYLFAKMNINLLQDSLLSNVLLESVILVIQCLIIRKHSSKPSFLLDAFGVNLQEKGFLYFLHGIFIGFIICGLTYLALFMMKIGTFQGFGFKYYGLSVVILMIVSVFVRAIFAGICEEVFFRGVLLNYLAKYKGNIFGLIISSLIFSIFHISRYQNLSEILSVLVMGGVLGYLYLVSQSLNLSIGLHFSTDFFISLAGVKNEPGLFILDVNPKYNLDYLQQSIFAVQTFICFAFVTLLIFRNYRLGKTNQ